MKRKRKAVAPRSMLQCVDLDSVTALLKEQLKDVRLRLDNVCNQLDETNALNRELARAVIVLARAEVS